MNITRTWLQDQFDDDLLDRGEACFLNGQVSDIEVLGEGHAVSGEVNDTTRYSIYIDIDEFGADGDCSCPTGYNCEHVAALLIACLAAQCDDQQIPAEISMLPTPTQGEPQLPADISQLLQQELTRNDYPADIQQRILYILRPVEAHAYHIRVHVVSARLLKDGAYAALTPFHLSNLGNHVLHRFVMPVDAHILQCVPASACETSSFLPYGQQAADMMMLLLQTGRCYWLDSSRSALKAGESRCGEWYWHVDSEARQHLRLRLDQSASTEHAFQAVLPTSPPIYVDTDAGICGMIKSTCPDHLCASLLFTPPVEPDDPLPLGGLSFDWPDGIAKPQTLHIHHEPLKPVPLMQLISNPQESIRLMFDYGGTLLPQAHGARQVYYQQGHLWLATATDPDAERAYIRQLDAAGLIPAPPVLQPPMPLTAAKPSPHWLLPNTVKKEKVSDWPEFLTTTLPKLQQAGFRIETMPGFRYEIVQVRQWDVACKNHGIMGEIHFEVVLNDGLHIDLIEIVANWIRAQPERLSEASLKQLAKRKVQYLPLPDGRILPIAGEMLSGMLIAMLDMFSMTGDSDPFNSYNTTAMQWIALRDVLMTAEKDSPYIHIQDDQVWRERMRQLTAMHDMPQVTPPTGLSVSLRDYQQYGLNWLQHLRRLDLGALLADDMGLGKTIQTLAHVLKEKEDGRLLKPALVIAPTSLMHNWKAEAARFAPDLNVLLLHGNNRNKAFASIAQHDLVLTTYALLQRDSNTLKRHTWSMLILDEAQYIRNPRTGAARIAREIQTDQRICLTGTPMENHLGELWALFDFLMPGYLSDLRTFKRCFRKPIEQEGDSARQSLLNLRIRPFMLRRSKAEVATELPAKTDIISTVEMEDAQRELYEGIRLLMHQKVRDAMQQMGKGKSNIIMLNALLKMRQVCCDPRLLKQAMLDKILPATEIEIEIKAETEAKTETAMSPKITLESIDKAGSAKLELLRQMLPEMIAEGRRILLFSQFTRMLKLIADLCDELAIPYVTLTGATRDRATPVEAFQNHKVPLFLISLKAGGVGLNLTAADTVIHYDPWWNPAAEAQASDRAHRIGQDKPVFVYKLITAGSVESRILDMQVRKQKLADALYKDSQQAKSLWSDVELESLFAPLDE
ncbi:DEAD/DEAH box helicase [Mariprofundus ferrooxydans]|nr:DEAD/DEAH box helicase [Mariprofundus ferrooxydans]